MKAGNLKVRRFQFSWLLQAQENKEAGKEASIQPVISAADAILSAIPADEVAKHLALKTPGEGPGVDKQKKRLEEQKSALNTALQAKAQVLINQEYLKVIGAP